MYKMVKFGSYIHCAWNDKSLLLVKTRLALAYTVQIWSKTGKKLQKELATTKMI